MAFFKLFYLEFGFSSDQWKIAVAKILSAIWEAYENIWKYEILYMKIIVNEISINLVRIGFLPLFYPLVETIFQEVDGLLTKAIFFVYSETCSTSKTWRILYTFIK